MIYSGLRVGISIHAPTQGATGGRFNFIHDTCISIHAPTQGATPVIVSEKPFVSISIHAPTQGATVLHCVWFMDFLHFNPRPYARGDLFRFWSMILVYNFNPRPYARGDLDVLCMSYDYVRYFNPRPYARGDDEVDKNVLRLIHISIHAPTQGATIKHHSKTASFTFQSTPLRKGRRLQGRYCNQGVGYFNPRPYARGDSMDARTMASFKTISIHAPTQGATTPMSPHRRIPQISIHAPTQGATTPCKATAADNIEFQSTPLRKGRLLSDDAVIAGGRFQSTPLRKGRLRCRQQSRQSDRFQSTPLRKGRLNEFVVDFVQNTISIHAPTQGATLHSQDWRRVYRNFNPRPYARGDKNKNKTSKTKVNFNPRPYARGDDNIVR